MNLKEMMERRKAIVEIEIDKAESRDALDALDMELRKLDLQIAEEKRKAEPERTQVVNSGVPGVVQAAEVQETRKKPVDDAEQMEYRKAFMDYVMKGTPIPSELRADAITHTTDVESAVPTVLVNRIIEKMETIGMILPLVSKSAFPAGVNIPTSTVKPVATWVAEGAGSGKQKKTTGVITFTHHKLRCEIAMTMETSVMALSAFEAAFVRQVSEAMVKAQEEAILNGAGTASPKGILKETPENGQALQFNALDYDTLIQAEAAIPQAYEGGVVWCMTKKTFMRFMGMVDSNRQPIARITYGIGGKPERNLLGRSVVLCGDYMKSFDTATAGDVFAFLFNFSDYTLNTIYNMGVSKKQDWDTEDWLIKAVMSCDGKVTDKSSLVTLAKKA